MDMREVEEVLDRHREALMAVPGVVGTAIGLCEGTPCIRVLMTAASSAATDEIPRVLEGFPVHVESSGPFSARHS